MSFLICRGVYFNFLVELRYSASCSSHAKSQVEVQTQIAL